MKSFKSFDKFGKLCSSESKELGQSMQENPATKFAPEQPKPCAAKPCPPFWQATGNLRCTDSGFIDVEENDGCGHTRWTRTVDKVIWTDTGNKQCDEPKNRFLKEQVNQCGVTRMVLTNTLCCTPEWEDVSSESQYDCTFSMLRVHQQDGCGHERYQDTGIPVRWVPGADRRCLDGLYEREESNQCGDSRWVAVPGDGLVTWVDTGETRCVGALIEKEQENQCGDTQWVAVAASITWVNTSTTSCAGDTYSIQQENQCGDTRLQAVGSVTWINTGEQRCGIGDIVEKRQTNQCGESRWFSTGTPCTVTLPPATFGQGFECHSRSSTHNASAKEIIRFHPDGSWTVSKWGGSGYLSPFASGTWSTDVPGDPGLYECRIQGTRSGYRSDTVGETCIGPDEFSDPFDTGWLPLSSVVEASVSAYAIANIYCDQEEAETLEFTATIREIAAPTNLITGDGSICAEASAVNG